LTSGWCLWIIANLIPTAASLYVSVCTHIATQATGKLNLQWV
jgi:hypothetical protein